MVTKIKFRHCSCTVVKNGWRKLPQKNIPHHLIISPNITVIRVYSENWANVINKGRRQSRMLSVSCWPFDGWLTTEGQNGQVRPLLYWNFIFEKLVVVLFGVILTTRSCTDNSQFFSYVLSNLAFERKWGWRWLVLIQNCVPDEGLLPQKINNILTEIIILF